MASGYASERTRAEETSPGPFPAAPPRERRQALLDAIEEALRAHRVPYRSATVGSDVYCAIHEDETPRVRAALRDLGKQHRGRLRAWLGHGNTYEEILDPAQLPLSKIAEAESLVIASPYRNGLYFVGRSAGVEILLLTRRDGRLLARQRRAKKVEWTQEFEDLSVAPLLPSFDNSVMATKGHAYEDAPVDVVYTWVDSADPAWEASRAEWVKRQNPELNSSANEERYLDREELRYSLRSLWLYAPFIRNVYIVTAGHYPDWLNCRNSRVHLIRHIDIFPDPTVLPTFNSHAIEACLHRIPGLAERFLYFNDDVFLGREVTIDTFYTKSGLIKSRFSRVAYAPNTRPGSAAIPTDWAAYNANRIIGRDFGLRFDRKMEHVPMPLTRSLLYEIERRYSSEVQATRAARFRSPSDLAIPTMLAHFYGVASGKAVEWEYASNDYGYADTGRLEFALALKSIEQTRPTFFCLNATRHREIDPHAQAAILRDFLQRRYPIASPFELEWHPQRSSELTTTRKEREAPHDALGPDDGTEQFEGGLSRANVHKQG